MPSDHLQREGSVTFVINCKLDTGTQLMLTGGNIQSTALLRVEGVPNEFWLIRSSLPLMFGWSIFLVDRKRVVGISRSTFVHVMAVDTPHE